MDYTILTQLFEQYYSFVLTTHVNPDGDGLGCELALASFLQNRGKQVTILNHSNTPDQYSWMDPQNRILSYNEEHHRDLVLQADVIIVLDTNHPDRLRSMKDAVVESKAIKVIIDHHLDADKFAHHYILDEDATSTGEIIYNILMSFGSSTIDGEIARYLYTAIMTDTGSFRYPRTDPETHRIIAHLLECGADPSELYSQVYERWSLGRMRLLGEVLDSMKLSCNGKLAYVVCTRSMFAQTGSTEVETDNFTTYPMSVKNVLVGILFNEMEDGVKISFRSKGNIPVNKLANEFGGGGHLNASGARLFNGSLQEIINEVLRKAEKYIP